MSAEKFQAIREMQNKVEAYLSLADQYALVKVESDVFGSYYKGELFQQKAAYFLSRISEITRCSDESLFNWEVGRKIARGQL